ncbi:MAG TPA: pitrilysin family protein [Steroidobacteraceae bacterium]|nr:pitrilysin family protein [Steroidobacteraceae bacterium]
MKKKPLVATLIAAAGIAMSSCQPKAETAHTGGLSIPPLQPQMRTLANGLRVYALPDSNTANVSVAVWYDVGSKNDPAGRSGFAHLFEHLMFKATANMPAESFDRLTEDVGGFNNASTADDYTNYFETVPANHLERIIWAESERMGSLVVDQDAFHSERDVVIEELRQRILAAPYGRLFGLYSAQANFDVHPYGRPGIGSIEDLQASTLEDVKAFHATYYRPDNAILVIVGNFDQKQLDAWVDKYFGALQSPKRAIPRVTAVEPARAAPKSLTVYAPNVPLPAVMVSWPAPAASSPDIAAWMVLDAILQLGQSSRLYQSLVYDQHLAAQVGSQIEIRQQPSFYSLVAILSGGKSADDGLKSLQTEIAKIRDVPVTATELEEARNELVMETLEQRETTDGRADELARSIIIYKDPAASDRILASLQSVTAADVQRVAKSIMDDAHSVTIRYLPEAAGAKGDVIADSKTIATAKIDIPAAEVPTYVLAPEDKRQAPPQPGQAVAAKVPGATEKTLANGLRVIVANRPGLPLVAADLRVSAGAALDPANRAGLATMTADLATRGTATRSATDISRQIESLGASLGGGAVADSSNLSAVTRSDKTHEVFAVLADVAINPVFKDEELDRARQEALDGLTVSLRQPNSVASFAMTRRLFGDGPYGKTPSPKSIAALTRDDTVKFHDSWWRPDNAVLVITGDITPEAGFALAEQSFAAWKKPEAALNAVAAGESTARAQPPLLIDIPKIGQAAVLMGGIGPSRLGEDYFATQLANNVLGGGYSSRLNQEIRVKRGLSYGASSGMAARKQGAPIIASAQTRNDAVLQVVDLMTAEMTGLSARPIPDTELASRKAVLIGGFGRSVETTGGLAGQLSALAQFGLPLEKLQTYAADINAVTPAQVATAAKAHFDPAAASLVVVGDAAVFGAKLKAKYPKLERIGIDKLNLDSATLK